MSRSIVVINPNSSERITGQIADAIDEDHDVAVVTSRSGPPAIETDADVEAAVGPLLEAATQHQPDAYVVACFSDPGLAELRAAVDVPVFGIAESAMRRALELGERVGVVSSVAESPPRHDRYWGRLGIADRVVADIPVGLGVLELDTPEAAAMVERVGRQLVAVGANVVVLGCTGMTHMQPGLEAALGVPVVDPCRAAVDAAWAGMESA